ncbi:MAG TPA: hypothetical protein VGA36_04495 [Nitriliruptorales bacterium]
MLREPVTLRGVELRYLLTLAILDHGGPITVGQLCNQLARRGVNTPGRLSKDISDALRWEIDRGRVRRTARSTYTTGHLAHQTVWRMRNRFAAHVAAPRAVAES